MPKMTVHKCGQTSHSLRPVANVCIVAISQDQRNACDALSALVFCLTLAGLRRQVAASDE